MIYITSDHAGFELKNILVAWFQKSNKEFEDLYPEFIEADDYPDRAKELATKLKENSKAKGIAICGTGVGICIALNRYTWIRAVLSPKREIVRLSRQHNDSNIICLAGKYTTHKKAIAIVKVFLNTPFIKEERHTRRLSKIS
ncbi:MAG: RpiB/LacA/LacB family sugar-phosphate isomerase [candidate division SR1 bacterium]|nr:RpiB/LacA/LacB family sugar-phosphate isomerase [candidate division SR1 bacterium]